MRLFFLILFSIAPAVIVAGQSSPLLTPPGVVISECEWMWYSSRLSRRYSSSITVDDAASRERRENRRQSSRDETSGTKSLPSAPDPFFIGPKALEGRPYGFLYKVMIENKGAKEIKALTWEYVFLDPLNRSVISRHQFLSKAKITPGKKRIVSGLSVRQPTLLVRAEAGELPPLEQVIIKRVEYSDGGVWEQ